MLKSLCSFIKAPRRLTYRRIKMAELEHGPECDCGCNDEPNPTITLEFDDGESLLCEALFVFEVDGKEYVALAPAEDPDSEDVYLYEYFETGEDEFELGDIEDDAVFDKVAEEFDRIMEEYYEAEEE